MEKFKYGLWVYKNGDPEQDGMRFMFATPEERDKEYERFFKEVSEGLWLGVTRFGPDRANPV